MTRHSSGGTTLKYAVNTQSFNFVSLRGSILRNAMYNNDNNKGKYGSFPDPFEPFSKKISKSYGLKYAKSIEKQQLHKFEK